MMAEIRHHENRRGIIFFSRGWSDLEKFRKLVQNDMSTVVILSKSKPDVELQYGGRLGECHMSPEPSATLQGAATGRIQWHIPEPRITLQGATT